MRGEAFDFISNFSTLGQVVLGAFLATGGGLVANQLEWRALTRRRERNAALFFGEVLSTFVVILKRADATKKIGDPYGPITIRMLRSARREIDIYERNRENLLDLHDARLRARVHSVAIRHGMILDGIFDSSQEIASAEVQLRSRNLDEADRGELVARVEQMKNRRDAGYEFMMETVTEIGNVLKDLSPIAGHEFAPDKYDPAES